MKWSGSSAHCAWVRKAAAQGALAVPREHRARPHAPLAALQADNPAMTASPPPAPPGLDFRTLPLSPAMQDNLRQLGYLQMTPIQAASLSAALLGKDLIAQAKTGSGKTAAFALTLLANLNPRRFAVQALVLCPTRELADR